MKSGRGGGGRALPGSPLPVVLSGVDEYPTIVTRDMAAKLGAMPNVRPDREQSELPVLQVRHRTSNLRKHTAGPQVTQWRAIPNFH